MPRDPARHLFFISKETILSFLGAAITRGEGLGREGISQILPSSSPGNRSTDSFQALQQLKRIMETMLLFFVSFVALELYFCGWRIGMGFPFAWGLHGAGKCIYRKGGKDGF